MRGSDMREPLKVLNPKLTREILLMAVVIPLDKGKTLAIRQSAGLILSSLL